MPIELQIIRAAEFVRLNANGEFDLPASKAALAHLGQACRKRRIDRALLDLRHMRAGPVPRFCPTDLAELVDTFHEIGFGPAQRLAVLYATDTHHRARLFAFISARRGWKVRAFDDFEHAVLWLSHHTPAPSRSAERPVPIRFTATQQGHRPLHQPDSLHRYEC